MSQVKTLFDLPIAPEQFGVLLPPAELRKIDFSALEFATARRAIIEYIRTYYTEDFNDFVTNNGVIMLVELLAYVTAIQSMRGDILANEGFLPTAKTEDAITNHLALINQKIRRATPATIDVECSLDSPLDADVPIEAGITFEVRGEDGSPIVYELFRAPDDLISPIIIPAGKRGVVAYGIEGQTKTFTGVSDGSKSQKISIIDRSILEGPVRVTVVSGASTTEWNRLSFIEQAGPTEAAFEARLLKNEMQIILGDDNFGRSPDSNSTITVTYRTGGGQRGRIGAGVIDQQKPAIPDYPYKAPVLVRFRNITSSVGGTDMETSEQAKRRGPRAFATRGVAVTDSDYAALVNDFAHPSYGAVSKSLATIRTSLNANLVELYVLAEGPNKQLVTPSEGLKRAIETYIKDLNVLTDSVAVLPGSIRAVDVQMNVIIHRSADASVVKTKVDAAVDNFFDITNWEMGKPFHLSSLIEVVKNVDGVVYVDIFKPTDNILPTNTISGEEDSGISGIGKNEVITLGDKQISYYYDQPRQI